LIGFVVAGVASVLSVVLRHGVPLTSGGALVDDYLYVRIAGYLAHGQWLGPFDQYTLLKGPAYPAFIAAMYRSGVPLKIGEQLTDLLAAAALAASVWVVTRRGALALVAYIVLALDPANFATYASRATRDGWYSSLSMLLVATVFLASYAALTHVRLPFMVGVSVLAGGSGAAFWLCREEPLWIGPSILVIVAGLPLLTLARWWFARPRIQLERSRAFRTGGRLALVLGIIGVIVIAAIVQVARENERHYGVATTNDLAYGAFARTYADWRRVDGGLSTPADPITRSQREAVYTVSPAARLLQPYLDPSGPCPHIRPTAPCDEPIWRGIRDAAAYTGAFHTESDVQGFFGELDAQIQAGCVSGQLRCTRRLPAQLQSLQLFSVGPFLTDLRHWAGTILTSTGFYDQPTKLGWILVDPTKRAAYMQVVRGLPASVSTAKDQLNQYTANNWPYRFLSLFYRLLIPCLFVAALIGAITPIVRFRWPQAALSVLSFALGVGALSRLVFVGLLDTTEFSPTHIDVRYLLAAHALFFAFGVLGTAQLADALWTSIRARRTDQPAEGAAVDDAREAG